MKLFQLSKVDGPYLGDWIQVLWLKSPKIAYLKQKKLVNVKLILQSKFFFQSVSMVGKSGSTTVSIHSVWK